MKYVLKIVFGKEQVHKVYNGASLTNDELQINVKEYFFDTIEEKNAFLKGIEEAIGWVEYCIPEFEIY